MTSKEALETLGNVQVAVSSIRTGITLVKNLKEEYEKEFEVLGKELLFVRDIKPFDVYEEQYKKLKKVIEILEDISHIEFGGFNENVGEYQISCNGVIQFVKKERYDLLKECLDDK